VCEKTVSRWKRSAVYIQIWREALAGVAGLGVRGSTSGDRAQTNAPFLVK
jgi:hypothetical protein